MTQRRFWPNSTQGLLLGVCLLRDRAAAIESWKEWKTRIDLDDLDHSSFQIMSLVCRRVLELGIADPDLRRIKGLHRYQWAQSQLASRCKRELLRALHAENISTMLLQGAALGQTVYPEPASRGVHDMDIAVPVGQAASAVSRLAARGWTAEYFDPIWTTECSHACALLHPDHGAINLRWRIVRSRTQSGGEEELWQAASPFEYEQIPTQILCPADQLLVGCEYGMYHSSASGPQWLIDCAFVIRHSHPPFDWPRLVDQSKKFRLTLHTRQTLLYLSRYFEDSIPREVIADLDRAPVTLDNRIEYYLAGRPDAKQHDLTHKFGVAACRYINLKQGGRLRQFLRDVPRFFRLLIDRMRQSSSRRNRQIQG